METDLLSPQKILNEIKETLPEYRGYAFNTWFNDVFNKDLYIIGTYKANANLQNYRSLDYDGPLAALLDAKLYLEQNVSENYTISDRDLNPEKAASLIAYCIADFYVKQALIDAKLKPSDYSIGDNQAKFLTALKKYQSNDWLNELTKL